MATVDDKKVIFSMVGVSKTIQQNQKQVLKNIYLSFFYGAKIGIIGLNGAGKSTLMKIIAGLDQQYQGNVVWSPGYSVGYLPHDPPVFFKGKPVGHAGDIVGRRLFHPGSDDPPPGSFTHFQRVVHVKTEEAQ